MRYAGSYPPEVCGIYQMLNERTGSFYIGASLNIRRRCIAWWNILGHGWSSAVNPDCKEHGRESFVFRVMLICAPEDLHLYETLLVRGLKPTYNMKTPSFAKNWPAQTKVGGDKCPTCKRSFRFNKARNGHPKKKQK